MMKKFLETEYAHILFALLIEGIVLLLLSFAGLFTLETILPGIISTRFIIGKLIIAATLLVFLTAFLGQMLGISFPITPTRPLRFLLIGSLFWAFGIFTISLLSFPLWSIPIYLFSFAAIGYFAYKELK